MRQVLCKEDDRPTTTSCDPRPLFCRPLLRCRGFCFFFCVLLLLVLAAPRLRPRQPPHAFRFYLNGRLTMVREAVIRMQGAG